MEIYVLALENLMCTLPNWQRLMSPLRQEKLAHLHQTTDQLRAIGAELILNYAMDAQGRNPHPPFCYRLAENGKPEADDVFFSLAHAGQYALCAVSDAPVGADLETPRVFPPTLARKIASPADVLPLSDLWVIKESYGKLTGRGIGENFTSLTVRGSHLLDAAGEPVAHIFLRHSPYWTAAAVSRTETTITLHSVAADALRPLCARIS